MLPSSIRIHFCSTAHIFWFRFIFKFWRLLHEDGFLQLSIQKCCFCVNFMYNLPQSQLPPKKYLAISHLRVVIIHRATFSPMFCYCLLQSWSVEKYMVPISNTIICFEKSSINVRIYRLPLCDAVCIGSQASQYTIPIDFVLDLFGNGSLVTFAWRHTWHCSSLPHSISLIACGSRCPKT